MISIKTLREKKHDVSTKKNLRRPINQGQTVSLNHVQILHQFRKMNKFSVGKIMYHKRIKEGFLFLSSSITVKVPLRALWYLLGMLEAERTWLGNPGREPG